MITRSLTDKLWTLRTNDPVYKLVEELEAECASRNLTLSRWQTNDRRSGWVRTVTWIIHEGNRAPASCYQRGILFEVSMNNREGRTIRCDAYKKLSKLKEWLDACVNGKDL